MTILRSESFLVYIIGAVYGAWIVGMFARGSGAFTTDILLGLAAGFCVWLTSPQALIQVTYPAVGIVLASAAAGAATVWIVGVLRPATILERAAAARKAETRQRL